MTTFEFQGQNFSMEGSAKTFIEKYLSRIQKYAENHAISEEVVDDLYQGIFEKLCTFEGQNKKNTCRKMRIIMPLKPQKIPRFI